MTPLTSTSSSPKRPRKPKPLSSMASRKHKRTTLIIFTLSLIAIIFFILTLTPPKLTYTSTHQIKTHQTASPVKMYMYDIPSRFTHDIIKQHSLARSGNPGKDVKYPGHQHMAEWYLFRDLMSGRGGAGRIVKVDDPEEAELFYVPVFSSLSLIVNPAGSGGYRDENMQEEFVKWLEGQVYWRRNGGWDHVIVAQDPNALGRVVDRVKNAVLLVSDFGRLRRDQASLVKDVIVPYSHRIRPFDGEVGVESRKTLLFFMGNRYRKEGGKIRDLLFQILENEDDVIVKHGAQSRESRRAASQGMHTSKFCLHPAGDTPSACRLFDAIVSMCIPVIVSDSIELPFEDVIDYRKIAVFVETANAVKPGELVRLLRAVPERKILDYQEELRKVKRYFIYDDPNGTVKEIWRQVSQKLPLIKLMINRDKRLVKRSLTESDCSCICTNKTGVITSL